MADILELPMRSDLRSYTFSITLEEEIFTIRVRFNDRANFWVIDIADSLDNDIVNGIPLQTNIPLTDYIVIPEFPKGIFIVIDETGLENDPDIDSLGNEVKLLYAESV